MTETTIVEAALRFGFALGTFGGALLVCVFIAMVAILWQMVQRKNKIMHELLNKKFKGAGDYWLQLKKLRE